MGGRNGTCWHLGLPTCSSFPADVRVASHLEVPGEDWRRNLPRQFWIQSSPPTPPPPPPHTGRLAAIGAFSVCARHR